MVSQKVMKNLTKLKPQCKHFEVKLYMLCKPRAQLTVLQKIFWKLFGIFYF